MGLYGVSQRVANEQRAFFFKNNLLKFAKTLAESKNDRIFVPSN
jgi:hypothetical protein